MKDSQRDLRADAGVYQNPLRDPFLADIVEAGWLPRAFFEAVGGMPGFVTRPANRPRRHERRLVVLPHVTSLLQGAGATARASHFVKSTPFTSSHNASDNSATKGGSKMAGNRKDASGGCSTSAKLFAR